MATVISSLSKSFGQVSPSAIPAMLDCILCSTGLSPSSLFDSLLEDSPNFIGGIVKENGKLDSGNCSHLVSLVGALCHLLKKMGANDDALNSCIWRSFLPLLMILQGSEVDMLNQITDSLIDVVIETDAWKVVESTLVPIFIRSIGLSMGTLQNGDADVFKGSSYQFPQVLVDLVNDLSMYKGSLLPPSGCFPLPISCHMLTVILEAAFQCQKTALTSGSSGRNVCSYADKFAGCLLWDLCSMTERMLLHSLEHRSSAIGLLLPIIFKAFTYNSSFEVSICGQKHTLSWASFLSKMWKCCRTLCSLGVLERRDAYNLISLYFSFYPSAVECQDAKMFGEVEDFNIRSEEDFWDEIKKGLVDKESLVRKQCLHILKMVLHMHGGDHSASSVSETNSSGKRTIPSGMTKRELWADKEAKSLGVGKICTLDNASMNTFQYWEAFILLYEMLEEYGTHLVEAAWNHQVLLLLQYSASHDTFGSPISEALLGQNDAVGKTFNWLSILWERGFCHHNPQVRCLIMQSFLDISWESYGNVIKSVPVTFVLGSFIEGLNDPIHHKDFGVKGVYISKTIEGAACFLHHYTSCLDLRTQVSFLSSLAATAKQQSFGRAGLMSLAECIASAATGVGTYKEVETEQSKGEKLGLLDVLRYVIESSKQHFNPNYRLRVCDTVLEAAASVVCAFEIPPENLFLFISSLPREFTDSGGVLRAKVKKWLLGCGNQYCSASCCTDEMKLLNCLHDFPQRFSSHQFAFDDEDLIAWESEATRWARVFFLSAVEEHHLTPILTSIQNYIININQQNWDSKCLSVKFLILILSLVLELQMMQEQAVGSGSKVRTDSKFNFLGVLDGLSEAEASSEKFIDKFLCLLEHVIALAEPCCSIFWSGIVGEELTLPSSVKGKLGGRSQRRLPLSTTTSILRAIMVVKVIASVSMWCAQFKSNASLNSAFTFMWQFSLKTISSPAFNSETDAEICLATYEALVPILRALVSMVSPLTVDLFKQNEKILPGVEGKPLLDTFVVSFVHNINCLLSLGGLARARRAILLNWKWMCLEYLLSIPYYAAKNGLHLAEGDSFFSDATLRWVFGDLVDSLENAGEGSVLPMLRSVRLALQIFSERASSSIVSCCSGVDEQMMWHLVRSSWILHVGCNKRRVAPIAALLSSVLHASVFSKESMHESDNGAGPLKWFVEKVLEEGTKSPRTIRLAALHLTGLWLSNPGIIKYYLKELKLLSLYGSVAFDEDFEGELLENHDARTEVSLLSRSLDSELTEAFINTELYARVSVAVLFYKLADLADMAVSTKGNVDCHAASESGKLFLLELLDSAVNDKDLAKELYKKYSAIHRRKIRAWQMICVLSRFVAEDILGKVADKLHLALYRNNLPAVRQYLETFAINVYLKFPSLVREQLVPILRDYGMRSQALSSYVFIAANVILHSSKALQSMHLDNLFPSLVPLLTSHHHSLRGFTQLIVHQILQKLFQFLDTGKSEKLPLEKRCFANLKSYLAENSDCIRLRSSMEGYLDAYNPYNSVKPSGIFFSRVEELEFECVPTSLMDQVLKFLNDVREDLRFSMAKDVVTIRNESLGINRVPTGMENLLNGDEKIEFSKDFSTDFQKKVTISKHEKQETDVVSFFENNESYKKLADIENDDILLDQLLLSRRISMEKLKASRQQIILVASLIDRIPNLAGLARTCEVFKASGLTLADTSALLDKQFQLISVTAEKWVPVVEVPVNSVKVFLEKKKKEGFSILGLEQTVNSVPLDQYVFPKRAVLVLGREKEGIPVDIIHILDACIEIPQLGVVRSLNVHVSGAIALWEYTRQQRSNC